MTRHARSVTTMTPAQWSALVRYREEWYAVGSACGASDRPRTTAMITALYAAAHRPAPRCLFFPSPASAVLFYGATTVHGQFGEQLSDQFRVQLRDKLWGQLREQFREQLSEELSEELRDQLREPLLVQIGEQLRDQLSDQFGEPLPWCFWGQYDSHWIAYYQWMRQIGIQYTPDCAQGLDCWEGLARSCGLWWPYTHVCLVADRPVAVHVDAARRLHHEHGPALRFGDGTGLWAWHGVRVSQSVIEQPETLTVDAIHAESNTERRRVMIERWGWERYLDATHATLRDVDTEPAGAAGLRGLYWCQDASGLMQVLICCCASTGKAFALEVPLDIETCVQAAAWLANTEQLHLLIRT